MADQPRVQQAWLSGVEDRLCAREQAKAWALREVWKQDGKKPYGLHAFVASKVKKTKNGKPCGAHPTSAAIQQLFDRIDNDPDWYPGKQSEEKARPEADPHGSESRGHRVGREAA